jgi:Rod binding domain-containing protein
MALPPHLARFNGLIDLIVAQIVKEIERPAEDSKPAANVRRTARRGKRGRERAVGGAPP